MISIAGLGASLALSVIDRTKEKQLEMISSAPEHELAIEKFREAAANVQTVEDFVKDYPTYNLVMKAHDLENHMFGKGMIRKILESDITDKTSLVRRMSDDRFLDLFKSMGFTEGGTKTENTSKVEWQERMIARYVEQTFVGQKADEDPIVGAVLAFRTSAGDIDSYVKILGDENVSTVVRTALGIPKETAGLDIDRQVELLKEKMDIEDLKDPEFLKSLERKYVAISEAQNLGYGGAVSPVVQLFQSGGDYVPFSIDFNLILAANPSAYRT